MKSLLAIWFVISQFIILSLAIAQTNPIIPKVGETWFFDDRNPWHRTYYEGTVLAVSNGWVLVKDSLGKTNSWSVGAMGTFHKKMPPIPNLLTFRPTATNVFYITNTVASMQIVTNASTNIVITITIQK